MFRKTLSWLHLTCGVTAGLVVLMMSVTGVLLAYERQILAWADRAHYADAAPGESVSCTRVKRSASWARRSRPSFRRRA